jgi:hypothetical protein
MSFGTTHEKRDLSPTGESRRIWLLRGSAIERLSDGLRREVIMPHFKEISNPNRVHRLTRDVV